MPALRLQHMHIHMHTCSVYRTVHLYEGLHCLPYQSASNELFIIKWLQGLAEFGLRMLIINIMRSESLLVAGLILI